MNDRQIAAFLSVAECGSFSCAARKQYISPQAIIQQIDLLEKEIGVRLLSRTHRGVTLTEEGKQFYQGMLRISGDIRALLDQIRSTRMHQLRVGLYGSSAMMNRLCQRFSEQHPEIMQDYVMLSPEAWLDDLHRLVSGDLDLLEHAEVPEVYANGLDFLPVERCGISCALRPTHPLAGRSGIRPCDLSGLKIGIHAQSCVSGLAKLLEAQAPGAKLIDGSRGPSSAFEICSEGGIFLLASNNLEPYRPLRFIPFECSLSWTFGIVYRKNPSLHVRSFIDSVKVQLS